jgi:hypothetical protein
MSQALIALLYKGAVDVYDLWPPRQLTGFGRQAPRPGHPRTHSYQRQEQESESAERKPQMVLWFVSLARACSKKGGGGGGGGGVRPADPAGLLLPNNVHCHDQLQRTRASTLSAHSLRRGWRGYGAPAKKLQLTSILQLTSM